jgi:hypothetical protein
MSDLSTSISHADVQSVVAVEEGKLITGTVQDCTPYLERAQKMRTEGGHSSKELKHAASFPFVVVEQYCNNNGITFAEWMKDGIHAKRMMSDPSLSYFRIWEGKI